MTDTPEPTPQYVRPGGAWEEQLLAGVSAVPIDKQLTHSEAREANQAVEDIVSRLAALTVRRRCNQHACTLPTKGACSHPEARRDADYLRHMLDVLGLPGDLVEVTEADRAGLLDAMAQRSAISVDAISDFVSDD